MANIGVQGVNDADGRGVSLTLDVERGWWSLTDLDAGKQLLGSKVNAVDRPQRVGRKLTWRKYTITLDEGQEDTYMALLTAMMKVQRQNAPSPSPAPTTKPLPVQRASTPTAPHGQPAAVRARSNAAAAAARFVSALAILFGIVGVIGAIVIGAQKREECGLSERFCEETHPFVPLAIGVGFAVVFQTAVVYMVAQYILFRATQAIYES